LESFSDSLVEEATTQVRLRRIEEPKTTPTKLTEKIDAVLILIVEA